MWLEPWRDKAVLFRAKHSTVAYPMRGISIKLMVLRVRKSLSYCRNWEEYLFHGKNLAMQSECVRFEQELQLWEGSWKTGC